MVKEYLKRTWKPKTQPQNRATYNAHIKRTKIVGYNFVRNEQ